MYCRAANMFKMAKNWSGALPFSLHIINPQFKFFSFWKVQIFCQVKTWTLFFIFIQRPEMRFARPRVSICSYRTNTTAPPVSSMQETLTRNPTPMVSWRMWTKSSDGQRDAHWSPLKIRTYWQHGDVMWISQWFTSKSSLYSPSTTWMCVWNSEQMKNKGQLGL